MNAFGVDTRSDIYSLGVLLYELLTGTTPLGRERLRTAALHELVRLIKEEEAPRPSVRLSSSDHLPKIAAARKTEPGRLPKLVRGELDWIVMKCLEKDRARRYESASGLARDVEHYLADEPVEACPPSAGYRLRKFARKYRTPLRVAGAFLLLLVLGAIASTWQAIRATVAERSGREPQARGRRRQGTGRDSGGTSWRRLNEDLRRTNYIARHEPRPRRLGREQCGPHPRAAGETPAPARRAGPARLRMVLPGPPRARRPVADRRPRRRRHDSVAFMPDGRRLISSGITEPLRRIRPTKGTAGAVRLWDAATGRPIPLQLRRPLRQGGRGGTQSRRHSPGRELVAITRSCSGTSPRAAWSRWKGRPITSPTACASARTASAWFPSTAAGESHSHVTRSMRVWDASSRKPIMTVSVGSPSAKHPSARMVNGSSSALRSGLARLCTTRRRVGRRSPAKTPTGGIVRARGLQPGRQAPGRLW